RRITIASFHDNGPAEHAGTERTGSSPAERHLPYPVRRTAHGRLRPPWYPARWRRLRTNASGSVSIDLDRSDVCSVTSPEGGVPGAPDSALRTTGPPAEGVRHARQPYGRRGRRDRCRVPAHGTRGCRRGTGPAADARAAGGGTGGADDAGREDLADAHDGQGCRRDRPAGTR